MKIRRAELRDLTRIVEIERLCFPEETAFPPGMFVYLIKYAIPLVACQPDDNIIGFVMGYMSGRVGAIYTLDVHPRFRGQGVGGSLIRALEGELQSMGARAIRLETALENLVAMDLYHKEGYRERELIKNYYGRGKHAVRMWKNLA